MYRHDHFVATINKSSLGSAHLSERIPSTVIKGSSGTTIGRANMNNEPSSLLVPIMMFTCRCASVNGYLTGCVRAH